MNTSILEQHIPNLTLTDTTLALWSGCGQIISGHFDTHPVIVKLSQIPEQIDHQVISQSDFAKARKDFSYLNELTFYTLQSPSNLFEEMIPKCFYAERIDSLNILILEDFKHRQCRNVSLVNFEQIQKVIKWLAKFHALGIAFNTSHKFTHGGYWHLDTRPDEFNKMQSSDLKSSASLIATKLYNAKFLTLIHGDSKPANYAFDKKNNVLGYDFQYVGKGIGLQDLMLFMTSVLDNEACYEYEKQFLDLYFRYLKIYSVGVISQKEFELLEANWRMLWPYVWSDFYRFLMGWKPEHKKVTTFMHEKFLEVLKSQ